jgi:hypothetical protein
MGERTSNTQSPNDPITLHPRRADLLCVALLLAVTLAVYAPALFRGRVLLPADIVPLMPPWAATARERFPDYRFAQNQMLGPIFEYYSWRYYARERIRQGEVPLWNPYELGGNVLLANNQSAALYPPNFLLYLFPLPTGINLVTALHAFLTGLFMFGLLRALALRPVAAMTGALAWMFCGLQIVWTEFQTPTAALCWLPGALWAWERFMRTGGWCTGVFGAGGALAMSLLAGHMQFAFYVLLAFTLYAVFRCSGVRVFGCSGNTTAPSRLYPFLALFGALVFGIAVSMAALLPVLEMGRMNFRAGKPSYAASVALRLPPENLLTLLQPDLFGNPRDYVAFDAEGLPKEGHAYWGSFDFIEYTAYPGIPALMLALIGIFDFRFSIFDWRQILFKPRAIFMLLLLLGLLLALGAPVCAALYYLVPGYKQFNATARALCLFSFALAALAAYGVQRLTEAGEQEEKRRIGSAAAWVVVGIILAGLAVFPGSGPFWMAKDTAGREVARLLTDQWFPYALANAVWFLLFSLLTGAAMWVILRTTKIQNLLWLLPALAAVDLLFWGAGFNPVTDPQMLGYPTETTDFLRAASPDRVLSLETPGKGIKSMIVPNYNAVYHLREVQGADSLHTLRYHRMMELLALAMEPGRSAAFTDPNTIRVPKADHPLLDMLNVRYVTTGPESPLDERRFRRVRDAELTIWENPRASGRAWVVGETEKVRGAEEAFARLSAPDFDFRRRALVEDAAFSFQDGGLRLDPKAAGSPAVVTSFSPHRLTVRVDARGRGLLVLSEIAFPGWRARVDGRPAPVYTADYLLRAIPVTKGRHKVALTYEPASYRVGLFLSALALFAMAASLSYRSAR